MRTGPQGIELIKHFEGFRSRAYLCPAGKWTIGYGHTFGVHEGDGCNREEAEEMLRKDLAKYEKGVSDAVKLVLEQYQFDALVSFAYNVGLPAFKQSTLLKKLNAGELIAAQGEFLRWNKVGGVELAGLTRRRNAEWLMFGGESWR